VLNDTKTEDNIELLRGKREVANISLSNPVNLTLGTIALIRFHSITQVY
jgi:hypothetical protein